MALWMGYTLLVGGLVSVAAAAGEWALRARGRPGRFAWAAALAVSVALPVLALVRPAGALAAPGAATGVTALPLELLAQGLGAMSTVPSALERLEPWILGLWVVATVLLGSGLIGGLARLSLKARRWPSAHSGDTELLVSDGFGPALLGFGRPRVVVPRWALGLAPEQLRLVLLHEAEHRRAGDAPALLAAAFTVVAAPWNVAFWWQIRRLRAAVELDCDARVLRRGASPAAYGAVLLKIGTHVPGLPLSVLPVAALSNPPSLLERRLRMIVGGARKKGRMKALGAAAAAVLVVALACEAPAPTGLRTPGSDDRLSTVMEDTASVADVVARQIGEQPLVFVDEVLVPGKPSEIVGSLGEADIASIEVVKGPAAMAMMGQAAAGGVIRVTTKKGLDTPRAVREKEFERQRLKEITEPLPPVTDTTVFTGVTKLEKDPSFAGDEATVTLDGKPFHGDPSTLDVSTIDHIDVVKGGSAGKSVIHITTKKAARGGGEE
ncbi:MAG: hypothetical protein LJF04_03230 [Gemmatimonadetes bacterium]|nr:hypothetical protein [Gemmatimonadota bacterium]